MKVLLPIDGSTSSLHAAKYVATLSKNIRSPMVVTLVLNFLCTQYWLPW